MVLRVNSGELPACDWRSGEYCRRVRDKRYRSNVINWGMLPLQMAEVQPLKWGITFTSLALKRRWITGYDV